MPERPSILEQEHEDFRATARTFFEREVAPYHEKWEADGVVDREVWRKAGEAGLLCFDVEEEYGGAGDQGLPLQHGARRGGRPGRGVRARVRRAHRHHRPLHLLPRDRGAEAALAARAGLGRAHLAPSR